MTAYQMTAADKRHAIVLALKAFPDKSQHLIAQQIGMAESTVSYHMNQLANLGQLEPRARTVGKDGKSRPATRKAKAPVIIEAR